MKRRWSKQITSNDNGELTVELYRLGVLMGILLIDETDYHRFAGHSIRISSSGYAVVNWHDSGHSRQPTELHRIFHPAPEGLEVDHINRNKLDNRRCNLRHVTTLVNVRNSLRCERAEARRSARKPKRIGRIQKRGNVYAVAYRHAYLGCVPSVADGEKLIAEHRATGKVIRRYCRKK